jgi:hypothetical protein
MRAFLLSAALALSGCPETLLPDARIRAETEAHLGQPVIQVLNRQAVGAERTRYEVSTPEGRYACVVHGGNALDLGIINALTCRPVLIRTTQEPLPMSDTNSSNGGAQGRNQATLAADARAFGEEYRERLIALGRAQERASMAREEVQESKREAQESRPVEAVRRERGR